MALFRYHGHVLVAVYLEAEDGGLDFLHYDHGYWTNVTKQVMPIGFSGDNVYALPPYGTTIHVFANKFDYKTLERASKTGNRNYDLVWSKDKFVLKRQ